MKPATTKVAISLNQFSSANCLLPPHSHSFNMPSLSLRFLHLLRSPRSLTQLAIPRGSLQFTHSANQRFITAPTLHCTPPFQPGATLPQFTMSVFALPQVTGFSRCVAHSSHWSQLYALRPQPWRSQTLRNRTSIKRIVAASSDKHETNDKRIVADADHVSILGKEVPKEQLGVGATATATILFSVTNRVMYKLALVPLKDYPFFLAQALTFGYVVVYGAFLAVRYRQGIVTREMLELPKMPFVALGGLEALGLAAGMAAAANLPGASIPILTQTYLVWQLLLSTTILKKKYTMGQIIGCILVTAGVVVVVSSGSGGDVKSLGESGLFWPLVMIGSTAFSAGASIIKEFVFRDSATRLKGGSVDIFVVNTFGSTAQALFVLLLLPLLSSLKGIPFQQLPSYFREGANCFFSAEGAPIVPFIYVAMNLAFNISSLSLLKQSSAVVSSLSTTLAVPLSIWAFTFNLPLLGTPSSLPPGLFLGAGILVAGLAFYNFSGEKQQKELKD